MSSACATYIYHPMTEEAREDARRNMQFVLRLNSHGSVKKPVVQYRKLLQLAMDIQLLLPESAVNVRVFGTFIHVWQCVSQMFQAITLTHLLSSPSLTSVSHWLSRSKNTLECPCKS